MADLKDALRADLTAAMKARDAVTTSVLRMTLSAIMNEEVAGESARALTHDEEEAVITREVRKRRESAELYAAAGRQELADKETTEAAVLADYLPKPLSEDDLRAIVAEEIAAAGDVTMRQMGQVIKAVNARVKGRADGATVAGLVKAGLSGR